MDGSDISTWWHPKDVAARLGVTDRTVLRLVDAGRLDSRNISAGKVKRRILINPASVRMFLLSSPRRA